MAARYWTHGYDIYGPSRNYVFHNYHDTQDPATKWHSDPRSSDSGYARLMNLFGYLVTPPTTDSAEGKMTLASIQKLERTSDLGPYGFGEKRSFQEFLGYCGFVQDETLRVIVHAYESCGNMSWYPWEDQSWTFVETSAPRLFLRKQSTTVELTAGVDFKTLAYSAPGSVTAPAGIPNHDIEGCTLSAFGNFVRGTIAVVRRGHCSFAEKVKVAENAGAAGILIFDHTPEQKVINGTLTVSTRMSSDIPAVTLTHEIGQELVHDIEIGLLLDLTLVTSTSLQKDPPYIQKHSYEVTDEGSGHVTPLDEKMEYASIQTEVSKRRLIQSFYVQTNAVRKILPSSHRSSSNIHKTQEYLDESDAESYITKLGVQSDDTSTAVFDEDGQKPVKSDINIEVNDGHDDNYAWNYDTMDMSNSSTVHKAQESIGKSVTESCITKLDVIKLDAQSDDTSTAVFDEDGQKPVKSDINIEVNDGHDDNYAWNYDTIDTMNLLLALFYGSSTLLMHVCVFRLAIGSREVWRAVQAVREPRVDAQCGWWFG
jgi:hypothetical protein